MKKKELKPPIIQKETLLEIEKVFRRIWDKERKTDDLFKKAVSLREQVQALLVEELCKPEAEQNKEIITALHERLHAAEEAIDTVSELTKELRDLRDYFFGFMSEPHEAEKRE